jgi:hypothetical protein
MPASLSPPIKEFSHLNFPNNREQSRPSAKNDYLKKQISDTSNREQLNPAVQHRLDNLIGVPPSFDKKGLLKNYGSGLLKSTITREHKKAMLKAFFNYDGTILPHLTKAEKDECYRQLINKFPGLTDLINSVYKPQ